jgi:hypothetical protein
MADGSLALDEYFAAAPPRDIAAKIQARLRASIDADAVALVQQRRETWRTAYLHYYGFDLDGQTTSEVGRRGSHAQLSAVRVNNARTVGQALLGLITSNRITWRATAINGDVKAADVVDAANTTLEYLWKTEGLMRVARHWAELSIIFGEALCIPEMDLTRGSPTYVPGAAPQAAVEGGPPAEEAPPGVEFSGELRFNLVPPWRYKFDEEATCWDDVDWCAVGLLRNKHSLRALYPTTVDGQPTRLAKPVNLFSIDGTDGEQARPGNSTDFVMVTHFYHRATPALPEGRHVAMVGDEVLVDEQLADWPLQRLVAAEQHETAHGYTSWWDVLGIQQVVDGVESAIATNAAATAEPSIAMAESEARKQIGRLHGFKIFYMQPGAPEPKVLDLSSDPDKWLKVLDHLETAQRNIAGLNDVAMGQPDTAQMNAQAFAILISMAQQRNAPALQEWLDAMGRLGLTTLKLVSTHWPEAQKLAVTGKDNAPKYATVQTEHLKSVAKVFCEIGNPLEQSAPGRLQMVDVYRKNRIPLDANQIQQVADTGRLEPVANPMRDAAQFVRWEDEQLRASRPVKAHWSDDHLTHVARHKSVLDAPATRESAEILKAVDAHIKEHYALYWGLPPGTDAAMDPQWPVRIRIMLGQQGPPMEAPPPGAQPGGPSGGPVDQPLPPDAAPTGLPVPPSLPEAA